MDAIGYFIVITAVGAVAVIISGPRASTRVQVAENDEDPAAPAIIEDGAEAAASGA